MAVEFKELAGSPVESYEPQGMKAERRLLCAYEDRYTVLAALLGGGTSSQAGYPECPAIVATRVRIEPFEKRPDDQGTFDNLTADLNSYTGQFVEVVVNYEMPGSDGTRKDLPNTEPGTLLTYRMDFAGEYVVLPGNTLRWQSDATAPVTPEAVPTLRIPVVEHHVTWNRVSDPPWDAIRACVGAVNDSPLLGADAETVLFDGARAERQFTGVDGQQQPQFGWRITYVFREKTIKVLDEDENQVSLGWNHCYCVSAASGPQWDRIVDANGNTLYRTVDFSTLFQFGS